MEKLYTIHIVWICELLWYCLDADRDFEPSAEHLIHDYDDEGTIEEEENLSSESGDNDELDDLQKVNNFWFELHLY